MISPDELGLEVKGRTGDEYLVRCPYHDDNSPSARFNVRTGLFYCFACGTGKSAKQIAIDLGGKLLDEPEIARPGYEEPDIDWRTRFLRARLAVGNDYLRSRGVPKIAIEKLGIRDFSDGIIFPLFSTARGDIGGVQVRHYSKTPKYVFYGTRPAIYPLTGLSAANAVLVEGIFSVIRGRSAGFNVFAVMGASSLAPALKYFFDRTKVRGIFDPDEAGYTASAKLAAIGIACLKDTFEADEASVAAWKEALSDKNNFSMNAGYFIEKAIAKGARPRSLSKQVLKFEKENN